MNLRLGVVLMLAASGACTTMARPRVPIEGTYRLVYRELQNGTRLEPPAVNGLMTFAGGYRHVSIMEHDPRGGIMTLGFMSSYTLTDSVYTEHLRYSVSTAPDSGAGTRRLQENQEGSAPVTVGADGSVSYVQPLDGIPVRFTADSLTARLSDGVDHWVRVKPGR